jgi:site-specific DNA recombinase
MDVMDREQTLEFLRRHVKTDMLMKHLLSVDTACTMLYNHQQNKSFGGADGMATVRERPAQRVPITGKAAIYTRVSTDRQREEGASLAVQREACLNYCETHGLVVVAEFTDVQSGLDADRPQYMQAVELARSNGVDKLVLWCFDRLGRDTAEYIPLLKGLKRLGVDVVSVTQPTESMFMQQVIGIMAEEESRQISTRVTASKQRRYSEGKWGGTPPFGYNTEKQPEGGSILVPNDKAPLVTEMFTRYASGKYSLSDLRDYLNEHGVLKSRYAIWYILSSTVYLGMIRHGMYARSQFMAKPEITEAQGKHQPLVDQETFDKVQARLSANKNRGRGGTKPKYLFSGLIHCGSCGHKFVGRRANGHGGRKWIQYNCNRKHSFGDCKSHGVFETRVRDAVISPIETLLGKLKQEDMRAAIRQELAQQQEATRVANQQSKEGLSETIKRLEGRLTRLEDSFLDEDVSRDRYLARRDEILAQLEEAKAQLAAHPHLALPDMEQFFALADALEGELPDVQEWREIIEGLVDKVVIEGSGDGRKSQATIKVIWKPDFKSLLETTSRS